MLLSSRPGGKKVLKVGRAALSLAGSEPRFILLVSGAHVAMEHLTNRLSIKIERRPGPQPGRASI